jgi:hypothetical protein
MGIEWKVVDQPGFFGNKRFEKIARYNIDYGEDNWKIAWKWNDRWLENSDAHTIYTQAYFYDSISRESLWKKLLKRASDVYDNSESNVDSGTDFAMQENQSVHLQDIAIRKVLEMRDWEFQGGELVQIRNHKQWGGRNFSPGKVAFHMPDYIAERRVIGWWDKDSIEDFYQSNKFLLVADNK